MPKPVSDHARLLMLDSATALVRETSERNPLLLIMDNLHCADVPSLQLLEVVAREMRMQNVMIIGSYREPAADSRAEFRPAIGALASQDFFHGIALSGWDSVAVSEYLQACGVAEPPAMLVRAVLDRTEGRLELIRDISTVGDLFEVWPSRASLVEAVYENMPRIVLQEYVDMTRAAGNGNAGAACGPGRGPAG